MQLLACLRVIVATGAELERVRQRTLDPLTGSITADNEEQALRTLEVALLELLAPLQQLPLLAAAAGDDGRAALAAGPHSARQQLARLQLEAQQVAADGAGCSPAAAPAAAWEAGSDGVSAEQREQGGECNENGFDGDWRMSRRFCHVYLLGQLRILQSSLLECRRLLEVCAAAGADGNGGS